MGVLLAAPDQRVDIVVQKYPLPPSLPPLSVLAIQMLRTPTPIKMGSLEASRWLRPGSASSSGVSGV